MISPVLLELPFDNRLVPMAVAIVAIVLLMSSMRRMQKKQAARSAEDAPPPSPRISPQVGQIHRDLDELMVELQELSRRIGAEIDTRFVKLEAAMRDADRRIAVLHRLSRQIGQNMLQENGSAASHDARHTVIYELADAGFTSIEIARDLGRTPGEVELILNLRKKTA